MVLELVGERSGVFLEMVESGFACWERWGDSGVGVTLCAGVVVF